MIPQRGPGALRRGFSQTGRGRPAAPGFNGHSKIARNGVRAARRSVPAGAGEISMAPRRSGRGLWGYAPACCGRLCQNVPSSTLAVRCLYVTKDGSPTRRPAFPMELPRHASRSGRRLRQGRSRLVVSGWPCPRQGTSRCSRHARMPRSAMSPFGRGRPLRPWLVVNLGEGTAVPWA
jgi:hypothetical protein